MEVALNLYVALGKMDILTMLILPIHEPEVANGVSSLAYSSEVTLAMFLVIYSYFVLTYLTNSVFQFSINSACFLMISPINFSFSRVGFYCSHPKTLISTIVKYFQFYFLTDFKIIHLFRSPLPLLLISGHSSFLSHLLFLAFLPISMLNVLDFILHTTARGSS